jgi:pimeloyl-ACP methyl ester carboxylesterase
LALRIGAEHSDQIRAVIAIDGAPAFPMLPAAATPAQRIDIARQVAEGAKNIHDDDWVTNQWKMVMNMVTDPDRGAELAKMCVKVPPAVTVHYMTDLYAADMRAQLPSLRAPTLVLASASTKNPAVIRQARTTWMELLKGTPKLTLALFEDTRHFIQDDRPAEMDAAIEDFLAGREVKGYSMPATSQPVTSRPATSKPATQPSQ